MAVIPIEYNGELGRRIVKLATVKQSTSLLDELKVTLSRWDTLSNADMKAANKRVLQVVIALLENEGAKITERSKGA